MATYSRPGVYITEGPFSTVTQTGTEVTPTAFLGSAARGPVLPTRIDSWGQYKTLYGDLTNSSDLGYAVYHFFSNGGRTAYVTRVTHSTTTGGAAAVKAKSGSITGTIAGGSSATLFKVQAKNVGTWANYAAATASTTEVGLKVIVTTGLRNGIAEGLATGTGTPLTFNLAVLFNGVEVERWTEVSLDPDSPQYITTIVNSYSTFIDVVEVDAALVSGVVYTIAAATYTVGAVAGTNGALVDGDWNASVDSLNYVNGSLLINLVGQTTATRVNYALTYAETRGNAFVIIDPDPSQTLTAGITGVANTYSKSSYGAVYYPMLQMPDPARAGSATLRPTYPGGAIAGLYTRVEADRSVGKAPAGYAYDVRGAYGLAVNFTNSETGLLYDAHINTMKNIPGGGVIINGSRTLKKTDITKYVPVRRTLNFVKANVEAIAETSLFEPNGERTWAQLNSRISRFLSDLWSAGALKGRNSLESFYVICNATNNPDYAIQNGELHIEVGVALQAPAEFIVINISQFSGGSNTTVETV
jgi:hypothetical protein